MMGHLIFFVLYLAYAWFYLISRFRSVYIEVYEDMPEQQSDWMFLVPVMPELLILSWKLIDWLDPD
jgi:hypothetical protein